MCLGSNSTLIPLLCVGIDELALLKRISERAQRNHEQQQQGHGQSLPDAGAPPQTRTQTSSDVASSLTAHENVQSAGERSAAASNAVEQQGFEDASANFTAEAKNANICTTDHHAHQPPISTVDLSYSMPAHPHVDAPVTIRPPSPIDPKMFAGLAPHDAKEGQRHMLAFNPSFAGAELATDSLFQPRQQYTASYTSRNGYLPHFFGWSRALPKKGASIPKLTLGLHNPLYQMHNEPSSATESVHSSTTLEETDATTIHQSTTAAGEPQPAYAQQAAACSTRNRKPFADPVEEKREHELFEAIEAAVKAKFEATADGVASH